MTDGSRASSSSLTLSRAILSLLLSFFSVFLFFQYPLPIFLEILGWAEFVPWSQLEIWDHYGTLPVLFLAQVLGFFVSRSTVRSFRSRVLVVNLVAVLGLVGYQWTVDESVVVIGILFLALSLFNVAYMMLLGFIDHGYKLVDRPGETGITDRVKWLFPTGLFLTSMLAKEFYAVHWDLVVVKYIQNRSYEFLTLFGLLMLLLVFSWLLKRWAQVMFLAILSLGFSVLLLGDVLHHRFFGSFLRVANWEGALQLHLVIPSIVALLEPLDVLYVIDWPVWLFFIVTTGRRNRPSALHPGDNEGIRYWTLSLIVGLICLFPAAIFTWYHAKGRLKLKPNKLPDQFVHVVSVPGFHLIDLKNHVTFDNTASKPEISKVRQYFSERNSIPESSWKGSAKGRNVLLVVAESLQSFVIDWSWNEQELTPNLNQFKRNATFQGSLFDVTSSGRSGDAKFAFMNGLIPLDNRATPLVGRGNDFLALPEILARQGYSTHSLSGSVPDQWNSNSMFKQFGIQHRRFNEDWESLQATGKELINDRRLFIESARYLKDQATPHFSMLISSTSHHPFRIPAPLRELELGRLENTILGDYYQSMRYFDRSFGILLNELEKQGLRDNTVIVLVGDHEAGLPGEVSNSLEGFGNNPVSSRKFDRVPILISVPGTDRTGHDIEVGSQVDVAPTVLGLLGQNPGEYPMLGRDLTGDLSRHRVVFPDRSMVRRPYVFLPNDSQNSSSNCYDYESEQPVGNTQCGELRSISNEITGINQLLILKNLIPEAAKTLGTWSTNEKQRVN